MSYAEVMNLTIIHRNFPVSVWTLFFLYYLNPNSCSRVPSVCHSGFIRKLRVAWSPLVSFPRLGGCPPQAPERILRYSTNAHRNKSGDDRCELVADWMTVSQLFLETYDILKPHSEVERY